jgi:hypothetical protein
MLGCVNPARCVGHFFLGLISAQREQSNRLATTLTEAPEIGPWVAAHGGWATFYPTKDDKGKSYRTLVTTFPGCNAQTWEPTSPAMGL